MHPNGQLPAYEFGLSEVNPPVHAWAAWRAYKIAAPAGARDTKFLARVFQKLLLNFTWWVNRKDTSGRNLFSGGFLGLDNIGVFDRSLPLAERQLSGAGGRDGVDRVLLPHDAVDGAGAGADRPGVRRHGVQVLRALRADRRRDEQLRRQRPVGRGRRLLLRPPPRRRARGRGAAAVVRRSAADGRLVGAGAVGDQPPAGLQEAAALVSGESARSGRAGVVHQPGRQDLAGDPVARPAGAAAAPDAGRARIPVPVRRAVAVEGARASSRSGSSSAVRRCRSRTSRASRGSGCSAATATGAGRSGCRPTTC